MPFDQLKKYLKYLRQTLGVRHIQGLQNEIVQDDKSQTQVSWELGHGPEQKHHLLFLIFGESWEKLDAAQKDLFLKVRAAMKLSPELLTPAVVAPWNESSLKSFLKSCGSSPMELIWLEEQAHLLETSPRVIGDHTLVVIPSLALMLQKQVYKKMAWDRIR